MDKLIVKDTKLFSLLEYDAIISFLMDFIFIVAFVFMFVLWEVISCVIPSMVGVLIHGSS